MNASVVVPPSRQGAQSDNDREAPSRDRTDDRQADRATSVFIRRLVVSLVAAGLMGLALWWTDSPDVSDVLPYFFVAIALQFLPMFWPADADAFAPAALPALLIGPELIADVIRTIRSGSVDIAFLDGLPPSTRVDLVQKVLILWILSSVAYLAGYYLGIGRGRVAKLFPRVSELAWDKTRMLLACGACFGAFVIAYAFFQSRVSIGVTDVTGLAEGKAVWREDPTMSWMGRGVLLGCIPLLFLVAAVSAKPTRWRLVLTACACVVMALLTTRLGQRGYGFMFGLSCLIIVHNVYKRFRLGFLTVLGFVGLVAFNVMGEWRRGEADRGPVRPAFAARAFAPDEALLAYASDRNRIAVLAAVMYYVPERQDYFLGESYVALLAAPIPKWIWPEKQDYFKWRDSAIAGTLHGIPAPTPIQGVLYANFSWTGVVIGMFLWGLFQRGLYEWLLERRKDRDRALLYSGMVLYLAPSSLALASTLQYVVPVWFIIKFAGRRRGVDGATSTSQPSQLGSKPCTGDAT